MTADRVPGEPRAARRARRRAASARTSAGRSSGDQHVGRQLERGLGEHRLRRRLRRHDGRDRGDGRRRARASSHDVVTYTAQRIRDVGAPRRGPERVRGQRPRRPDRDGPAAGRRASTARTQDILRAEADKVRQAMSEVDGVVDPRVRAAADAADHIEIEVDLDRAQRFGVKPGDVRRAEATLLQGIQVGSVFEEQKVFDVVVQGVPDTRAAASATCADLLLDRPGGGHVRLGQVADVRDPPDAGGHRARGRVALHRRRRRVSGRSARRGRRGRPSAPRRRSSSRSSTTPRCSRRQHQRGDRLQPHARLRRRGGDRDLPAAAGGVPAAGGSRRWSLAGAAGRRSPAACSRRWIDGRELSLGAAGGLLARVRLRRPQRRVLLIRALQDSETRVRAPSASSCARACATVWRRSSRTAVAVAVLALPFVVIGARGRASRSCTRWPSCVLGGLVTTTLVAPVRAPRRSRRAARRDAGRGRAAAPLDRAGAGGPRQAAARTRSRREPRESGGSPGSRSRARRRGRRRRSPLAGCTRGRERDASQGYEPATLEAVDGQRATSSSVIFTPEGAPSASALETRRGRCMAERATAWCPYAALIYDAEGDTYVYASPEPLAFVREAGRGRSHRRRPRATCTTGPAAGTAVVTVGRGRGLRRRARDRGRPLTGERRSADALDRRQKPAVPVAGAVRRRGDDGLRHRADPERAGRRLPRVRAAAGRDPDASRSATPPNEVEELITVPLEEQLNGLAGPRRAALEVGRRSSPRSSSSSSAAPTSCRPRQLVAGAHRAGHADPADVGEPAVHDAAAVGDQPDHEDRPDLGRRSILIEMSMIAVLEDQRSVCCAFPASRRSPSGASGSSSCRSRSTRRSWRSTGSRSSTVMDATAPMPSTPGCSSTPRAPWSAPAVSSRRRPAAQHPATSSRSSGRRSSPRCPSSNATAQALRLGDLGRRCRSTTSPLMGRRRHQRRPRPDADRPEVPRGEHDGGDARGRGGDRRDGAGAARASPIDTTIFLPATFIEQSIDNLTKALAHRHPAGGPHHHRVPVPVADRVHQPDRDPAVADRGGRSSSSCAASTINVMVLAGLVVAIGVVVDDAIIDVENIVRRLRQERAAGQRGSRRSRIVLEASVEVRGAIIYATVINVVAHRPVSSSSRACPARSSDRSPCRTRSPCSSRWSSRLRSLRRCASCSCRRGGLRRDASRRCCALLKRWLPAACSRDQSAAPAPAIAAAARGRRRWRSVVDPMLGRQLLPNFKERDFLMHWLAQAGHIGPRGDGGSRSQRARTCGRSRACATAGRTSGRRCSRTRSTASTSARTGSASTSRSTTMRHSPTLDRTGPGLSRSLPRRADLPERADQGGAHRHQRVRSSCASSARTSQVLQREGATRSVVAIAKVDGHRRRVRVESQRDVPHIEVEVDLAKAQRLRTQAGRRPPADRRR